MKTVALLLLMMVGCEPGKLRLGDMATERHDLAMPPEELPDLLEPPSGDMAPVIINMGPTRYPTGILHSPLTSAVIDRLSLVLASGTGRPSVFAKVGDSITHDPAFLYCFVQGDVMLGSSSSAEPTRQYFTTDLGGGITSFDRLSQAAVDGWHTNEPLIGTPSPLAQEIAAISPGFAVVMLGTNDIDPQLVDDFEPRLTAVVDALLAKGVVPLLSTIPPSGSATLDAIVPEMNAVVRVVAQHRQIPYMDFWQTLTPLMNPKYGLKTDGTHPESYPSHPCWFTAAALEYGMNQRNKLVLDSLDRVKRALVDGAAPEAAPAALAGSGTFTDPYVVDALPFVDAADTTLSQSSVADVYSCATQNESGPEIVYKVQVTQAMKLRARVFVDAGVDVDLHWLSAPNKNSCISRNDMVIDLQAQPGTYWLSADTFVSAGVPKPGAYRLTIVQVP